MTRKRNRMAGFDYARNALYFITICTQDRICHFGYMENGKMVLSAAGQIAHNQWKWLCNQYPYALSHAFIVMPNHIHGILEIDSSLAPPNTKIKSLSELMGAYKTTSSKQIHLAGIAGFAWQRSFHDRIIRDGWAYERIKKYIETNPERS